MAEQNVAELFDRYGAMVYRRARVMLGDAAEAEDVAQEVFVKAFLERSEFQGRSELTTYLYRITTNLCINRIRDTTKRRELQRIHLANAPDRAFPKVDDTLFLRDLLASVEEREAQAAVYVHVDGMSYREAAEIIGVSKRTVGNLVARFNEKAQRSIREDPENEDE